MKKLNKKLTCFVIIMFIIGAAVGFVAGVASHKFYQKLYVNDDRIESYYAGQIDLYNIDYAK